MTSNGEPLLLEEITDCIVRFVLVIREFRVRPDLKEEYGFSP